MLVNWPIVQNSFRQFLCSSGAASARQAFKHYGPLLRQRFFCRSGFRRHGQPRLNIDPKFAQRFFEMTHDRRNNHRRNFPAASFKPRKIKLRNAELIHQLLLRHFLIFTQFPNRRADQHDVTNSVVSLAIRRLLREPLVQFGQIHNSSRCPLKYISLRRFASSISWSGVLSVCLANPLVRMSLFPS